MKDRQSRAVVFEFLKKKLQETFSSSAKPAPAGPTEYEERRQAAEAVHAAGQTEEAIGQLEDLAQNLAGSGNFPLAVAVRHQISQWKGEVSVEDTAEIEAHRLAEIRKKAEAFPALREAMMSSPFLDGLDADDIAGLIVSTELRRFSKGDVVVAEGTPGSELFIVTRGIFDVMTEGPGGDRVRVGTLTVGDFFGEVSLITGKPRVATVIAETDGECLEINHENWQKLSAAHPKLRKRLDEAILLRAQLSADAILDHIRKKREGS